MRRWKREHERRERMERRKREREEKSRRRKRGDKDKSMRRRREGIKVRKTREIHFREMKDSAKWRKECNEIGNRESE